MATLKTPTVAIQFIKTMFPSGREKPSGKFHLENPRMEGGGMAAGDTSMTVCKLIIWRPETDGSAGHIVKSISELKASDLCRKCLGPLSVED